MAKTLSKKILVVGDVCGHQQSLFSRIERLCKSKGPFDALFCVGTFFGETGVSKDIKVPIQTYFIAGKEVSTDQIDDIPHGGEIVPGITYLGRFGVKDICGLRVAYVSGMLDARSFKTDSEPDRNIRYYPNLKVTDFKQKHDFSEIDLLLTSEWPRGFYHLLDITTLPKELQGSHKNIGSGIVASIAIKSSPRYHFGASQGIFFQLNPYKSESGMVTRFIGLAKVDNKTKQKSLFACNLTPVRDMASEDVSTATSIMSTTCPYIAKKRKKPTSSATSDLTFTKRTRVESEQKQMAEKPKQGGFRRWNMAPPANYLCNKCGVAGHFIQDCALQSSEGSSGGSKKQKHMSQDEKEVYIKKDCWFCLSSSNVETHLVVSVATKCYLALPKGGLTTGHVLIIPIDHQPKTTLLSKECILEIERYKNALRSYAENQGKHVVFFERSIRTLYSSHTFIQALPVDGESASHIDMAFNQKANELGFKFEHIPAGRSLKEEVWDDSYIYLEISKDVRLYYSPEEHVRIPLAFFRFVMAKVLGTPSKWDWKECEVSKSIETKLAQKFKINFKEFDIATDVDSDGSSDSDTG